MLVADVDERCTERFVSAAMEWLFRVASVLHVRRLGEMQVCPIGAGGGALVGAAAGNPLAGAVVGGLGGAAVGAATTPRRYYY